MREIKFRCWDRFKQRWSNYKINDGTVYFMNKNTGVWYGSYNKRYKDFNLMQYIGLKDKNEKEIYEGDIVKLRANHGIGVVKYYDEWGAFVVEYVKPRQLAVLGMNYYKEDIEILGNIYENSELLGDKNDF